MTLTMELEDSELATLVYVLGRVQFSDIYNDLNKIMKADLISILKKAGVTPYEGEIPLKL